MRKLLLMVLAVSFFASTPARASGNGKEFFLSIVYGTLAGTLVGAATLAFTSNPGDNLNNVARGASYGLYAGILLGLYVTYGMDDNPNVDPNYPPPKQGMLIPFVTPTADKKNVAVGAQLVNLNF